MLPKPQVNRSWLLQTPLAPELKRSAVLVWWNVNNIEPQFEFTGSFFVVFAAVKMKQKCDCNTSND